LVASSRLEDTSLEGGWDVGKNVEGGVHTSNSGEVEGSSVRVWKVSLSLQETKVEVQVVAYFVNPINGERSFLSQCKSGAVSGDISRSRETWNSIHYIWVEILGETKCH